MWPSACFWTRLLLRWVPFALPRSSTTNRPPSIQICEWRRDTKGRKELWWINASGNEPWDLEVYNYAAYLFCMSGRHAETVLRDREKLFGKVQQLDLLDAVQTPAAGEGTDKEPALIGGEEEEQIRAPIGSAVHRKPPPPKRPRGGFVNRWR